MYSNPTIRGEKHIYRLRWGYRRLWTLVFVVSIILIPLALYGYSLNSKEGFIVDLAIHFGMIGLAAFYAWITFQIWFVFRLETIPQYGRFYGLGKTITFNWQDVNKIDYLSWPNDNKYQLCLLLRQSVVQGRVVFPFFAIHYTDTIIPVDALYGYQHFLSLRIMRRLPSIDEQSVHLRHFIRSPLGQDLIRYAPHVFGTALNKYLPDNDLIL